MGIDTTNALKIQRTAWQRGSFSTAGPMQTRIASGANLNERRCQHPTLVAQFPRQMMQICIIRPNRKPTGCRESGFNSVIGPQMAKVISKAPAGTDFVDRLSTEKAADDDPAQSPVLGKESQNRHPHTRHLRGDVLRDCNHIIGQKAKILIYRTVKGV